MFRKMIIYKYSIAGVFLAIAAVVSASAQNPSASVLTTVDVGVLIRNDVYSTPGLGRDSPHGVIANTYGTALRQVGYTVDSTDSIQGQGGLSGCVTTQPVSSSVATQLGFEKNGEVNVLIFTLGGTDTKSTSNETTFNITYSVTYSTEVAADGKVYINYTIVAPCPNNGNPVLLTISGRVYTHLTIDSIKLQQTPARDPNANPVTPGTGDGGGNYNDSSNCGDGGYSQPARDPIAGYDGPVYVQWPTDSGSGSESYGSFGEATFVSWE